MDLTSAQIEASVVQFMMYVNAAKSIKNLMGRKQRSNSNRHNNVRHDTRYIAEYEFGVLYLVTAFFVYMGNVTQGNSAQLYFNYT